MRLIGDVAQNVQPYLSDSICAVSESADVTILSTSEVTEHGIAACSEVMDNTKLVVILTRHDGIVSDEANGSQGPKAQRIITPMAVLDVTPIGLIVSEVAHGIAAADVQQNTTVRLRAGPNLRAIPVPSPSRG